MKKKDLEKIVTNYIIDNKEKYYRLAYSYVKNPDDTLDIVQESIYKALSSINKLKNPDYINTWFYRIVVNTSLDHLRKQKKIDVVDEVTLENYSDGIHDNYQNVDLLRALDDLPVDYRSIIVLRYFEGLKIEEIANVLNENVNTIKTRLYSALKKLKIKLDA
ncbi:sigma-70 family RNA polymerase sigma factor [Vallitalea guaymasensis]|uniref:Sigma-70 family RNA polymerase sigma factor n=1 Tax=Vallitalea guaymasensis TaxID=1185412 RepID=A0A8J8MBR8_9FIRM|nr:sigma-70 family RNA polymerase sigma factor [Vallitalea guaymasensis]QUH29988.1 sigma-70 family RNA polymerase sigma factor [Vallitalea guaymasensis]